MQGNKNPVQKADFLFQVSDLILFDINGYTIKRNDRFLFYSYLNAKAGRLDHTWPIQLQFS